MTKLSVNASDYLDNSGRPLIDPNCEFGELLNNLWVDANPTWWATVITITIPAGEYYTATPIKWLDGTLLCYADDVTINWSGGNNTVLTLGADPDNLKNQNNPTTIYPYVVNRSVIRGITFNNISTGYRSYTCVGLRMQNGSHSVFENLNFNGFGTASMIWSTVDPTKNQYYYAYFNAFRNCHYHDCDVGFYEDGEYNGPGLIADDNTTIELTHLRSSVSLISGTLSTDGTGDYTLPTSGTVTVRWLSTYYRIAVCTINGSRQITWVSGETLPTSASVDVIWTYGTRTGCHVVTYPKYEVPTILVGGTQGVNLPDVSIPVTLTWTQGACVYPGLHGRTLTGGVGNPLPSGQTVTISWVEARLVGENPVQGTYTAYDVPLVNGVLGEGGTGEPFVPENVICINSVIWEDTLIRTDVYLVPDDSGNLIVTGGSGDIINLQHYLYLPGWLNSGNGQRDVDITWDGGSFLNTCHVQSVYHYSKIATVSGGTGDTLPTGPDYVGTNVWQQRTATVPIQGNIVTLSADHPFMSSMTENTASNVTVTWNDGTSKTRIGCTFNLVRLEAALDGGSGDTLPTTGTVTITQTRGTKQFGNNPLLTNGVITYSWGYPQQSHCNRLFHIKGTGNINTMFEIVDEDDINIMGVDFQPTNTGSYLLKGHRHGNIYVDYLGDIPTNIEWRGIGNSINSRVSLDNLTIIDQSGQV